MRANAHSDTTTRKPSPPVSHLFVSAVRVYTARCCPSHRCTPSAYDLASSPKSPTLPRPLSCARERPRTLPLPISIQAFVVCKNIPCSRHPSSLYALCHSLSPSSSVFLAHRSCFLRCHCRFANGTAPNLCGVHILFVPSTKTRRFTFRLCAFVSSLLRLFDETLTLIE